MTAPVARAVALSAVARDRLNTCHMDLVCIVAAVAETRAIQVICGVRGQAEQDAALKSGNSELAYPNSYHNQTPSLAVDIAPLIPDPKRPGRMTIDWQDLAAFDALAVEMKAKAAELNIPLEWGGDWRSKDRPHFQLGRTHPDVMAWREKRGV